MSHQPELITIINRDFSLTLSESLSLDELKNRLAEHINYLIQSDFQKLVQLLYRIDINEIQLKKLLTNQADEDAAQIIAGLILEREMQKIKTRRQFNSTNDISDYEKW